MTLFSQIPKHVEYRDTSYIISALNTYHTDLITTVYGGEIKYGVNTNNTINTKLLSLFKKEWTREEIEKLVIKDFRNYFEKVYLQRILNSVNNMKDREKQVYDSIYKVTYTEYLLKLKSDSSTKDIAEDIADYRAKDEAKKKSHRYSISYDSVYRHIFDSTAKEFKKKKEIEILEMRVPDEIILNLGTAKIKEAIPLLKNILITNNSSYANLEAVEKALAALGDSMYIKKILKKHKDYINKEIWQGAYLNDDLFSLHVILRSQESYYLISDWLDTTRTYREFSETGDTTTPIRYTSAFIVSGLLSTLKNKDLISGFKNLYQAEIKKIEFDEYSITPKLILYVKNWLIANKGRYEFW